MTAWISNAGILSIFSICSRSLRVSLTLQKRCLFGDV